MGFYIEELPTEFNGITMEEADYLADEFLKDTPCNRMWDAMRALRDFYETVTSEAVEVADRKTENSSEKPNNCETCKHWEYDAKYRWWHCPLHDNGMYECHYEPRKLTAVEDEPQTDCAWKNECK